MLVIALLLEGYGREQAARQSGMDLPTLRNWVHRYKSEGVGGLFDRPNGGGALCTLTATQESDVVVLGSHRTGPRSIIEVVAPFQHSIAACALRSCNGFAN